MLTPAVYELDKPIEITKDKTLVLGLGMPILKAKNANALTNTSSAQDTILAGFVIVGSATSKNQTLVTIGNGKGANSTENPNMLFDIFCRVGAAVDIEETNTCMQINDSDIIGCNLGCDKNTVDHGLIVNGKNGSIDFYQSELPYDPPSQNDLIFGIQKGYPSLPISKNATNFKSKGFGGESPNRHSAINTNIPNK